MRMAMPREIFEELMSELVEGDAEGLLRDAATQQLGPTSTTAALHHWKYTIKRGSVLDRLFRLQTMDPTPSAAPQPPAALLAQVGDPGVFEVEAIRASRWVTKKRCQRKQYLVKWRGFAEAESTWEPPSHINRQLVRAYERPTAAPPPPPRPPSMARRGLGAARAHLSGAEQRRGGSPSVISMVCGNTIVHFKESRKMAAMPTLEITFKVLSMDAAGHIIWPTDFTAATKAALRMQARALLRKMIDDPQNPCDETMEPALTGMGTSSMWKAPPKRQLVVVQPEVA